MGEEKEHHFRTGEISRRDFLKWGLLSAGATSLGFVAYKIQEWHRKGLTLAHAVSALRRVVQDPEVVRSFWQVEEGISRGEVIPDLSHLSFDRFSHAGYEVIKGTVGRWQVLSNG